MGVSWEVGYCDHHAFLLRGTQRVWRICCACTDVPPGGKGGGEDLGVGVAGEVG